MRRKLKTFEGEAAPPSEAPQSVGFLLKRLQHSLRQSFDEALRRAGMVMSFAQVASLFGLYYEPGSTGAQLARGAMVSAQTMNVALHRLEQDGLIERRPHPESRRADSWFLTNEGARQFTRARAVGDPVLARMLAALSPAEVEQFEDYLHRCIGALGESADSAVATGLGVGSAKRGRSGGAVERAS
jgi:DNA-binding MarR family transcriptional regulator